MQLSVVIEMLGVCLLEVPNQNPQDALLEGLVRGLKSRDQDFKIQVGKLEVFLLKAFKFV